MTDNITIDNGGLADFETSTDYATSGHIQRVKLTYSADGDDTHIPADADGLLVNAGVVDIGADVLALTSGTAIAVGIYDGTGAQITFAAPAVLSVTPTLDTSAYADADSMDTTVLSFANAAAVTGGTGHVLRMTIVDASDQGIDMKLHLFSASVSPAAENAAHSLSDADAAKYIGTIITTSGTWQDHTLNQTCSVTPAPPIPYKLDSGTTLFGVLVSEGAGTYAADGVTIKLHVLKD